VPLRQLIRLSTRPALHKLAGKAGWFWTSYFTFSQTRSRTVFQIVSKPHSPNLFKQSRTPLPFILSVSIHPSINNIMARIMPPSPPKPTLFGSPFTPVQTPSHLPGSVPAATVTDTTFNASHKRPAESDLESSDRYSRTFSSTKNVPA